MALELWTFQYSWLTCLSNLLVPPQWKTTVFVPTHENVRHSIFSKSDPLSILRLLCIMKWLNKGESTQFILIHGLVKARKHGLFQRKSCNTCMSGFLSPVTKATEGDKSLIAIFPDNTTNCELTAAIEHEIQNTQYSAQRFCMPG